jgi:hypothetical protein
MVSAGSRQCGYPLLVSFRMDTSYLLFGESVAET